MYSEQAGRKVRRRGHVLPSKAVILTSYALLIGGCAGEASHYACSGQPSQPLCLPPSQVYKLTNGNGPPPASLARPKRGDAPVQSREVASGSLGFGPHRSTSGENI